MTDLHKTPKVKDQLLAFSVRPSVVNPADSCPGSKEATESGIAKTALSPAPACRVHTESELCQRRRFERKCNQYFHLPEKFSNSIRQNCLLSCLARAEQCWTGWGKLHSGYYFVRLVSLNILGLCLSRHVHIRSSLKISHM